MSDPGLGGDAGRLTARSLVRVWAMAGGFGRPALPRPPLSGNPPAKRAHRVAFCIHPIVVMQYADSGDALYRIAVSGRARRPSALASAVPRWCRRGSGLHGCAGEVGRRRRGWVGSRAQSGRDDGMRKRLADLQFQPGKDALKPAQLHICVSARRAPQADARPVQVPGAFFEDAPIPVRHGISPLRPRAARAWRPRDALPLAGNHNATPPSLFRRMCDCLAYSAE
jgi:hypothetical protein